MDGDGDGCAPSDAHAAAIDTMVLSTVNLLTTPSSGRMDLNF
jgi:hypothetical protein